MPTQTTFVVLALILSVTYGQLITGWSQTSLVKSTPGSSCYVRWDSKGFNIGVYFNTSLSVSDRIDLIFNLDTSKTTAPGISTYNGPPVPFLADFAATVSMSNSSVVFMSSGTGAWLPVNVNRTQSITPTSVEFIIYDSRFFSNQTGSPKFNFVVIMKNNQWLAPPNTNDYFGFLQQAAVSSAQNFINTFPFLFQTAGTWSTPSNWLYSNVPLFSDSVLQNVFLGASCVLDVSGAIVVADLTLNANTKFNLSNGMIQVGKNGQAGYITFESNSALYGNSASYLAIQPPAQLAGPSQTVQVDHIKILQDANQPPNTVAGPSGLVLNINQRLTLFETVVVGFPVTYSLTSVLEFSGIATRNGVSNEWIPTSSNTSNTIPNRIEITQVAFSLPAVSAGLEYKVKSDLTVQSSGSLTLQNSTLRVGGNLSVCPSCSIFNDQGTVYANSLSVLGNWGCNNAKFFEWDSSIGSYRGFPYLPVTSSNGSQVTNQYNWDGISGFSVDSGVWDQILWFIEPSHQTALSGATFTPSSAGNYRVEARHISGCYSSHDFTLVLLPSTSPSPSRTATPSVSSSPSASASLTPSSSPSPSSTPSSTPSASSFPSETPSSSATPSASSSPSISASMTPTASPYLSASPSASATVSSSASQTPSSSSIPSSSPSASVSSSSVNSTSHEKGGSVMIIASASVVGGVAVTGAIFGFAVFMKKRKTASIDLPEDVGLDEIPANRDEESTYANNRSSSFKQKSNEIDYKELSIGKELGSGAFGVVYKAKWRNTDVVVKQIDSSTRQDENSMKLFLRETANVQNARPHPNVCAVFGVCTNPENPICIVMEFVGGGSLDNLLYHGKIDVNAKMAIEFGKNIASGMSHLHQENILHCDLAARNLLVTQQDGKYVLKISDFGLSKVTETDTYTSNSSTFPIRWTPPEALRGGKITRAFDIWSFGIVMWEIIECKNPYPEMSNNEVINQVCDRGYRLPMPQRVPIPEELYQLMLRCWASNPEDRPTFNQICNELEEMYDKYYGEEHAMTTGKKNTIPDTHYSQRASYHNGSGSDSAATYGNKN